MLTHLRSATCKRRFKALPDCYLYRMQWDPNLACPSDTPLGLEIDRAEGLYLYSTDGKQYMDMIAGLSVSNIGHRHPKVLEAIRNQLDKHLHVMVYGEYKQDAQNRFAKALANVLPEQLNTTYFVNSGTEANEAALKLAKRATGRTRIIAFDHSYHGSTHGSLSVTGNETKKSAFRPLLPDVEFIPFNNIDALSAISNEVAAVIVEPIQGDAGIRIPSKEFMLALRDKCTESGALLVFDEVQTGFGRCGALFAFELFEAVPDILTIGKAMGGGMAMGAFVSSRQLMSQLKSNPVLGHITTFGGHPVCCAAGAANLDVIVSDKLVDHVERKGALLEAKLQHPAIIEIRRVGLFIAVQMKDWEVVHAVVQQCIKNGVIGFYFLSCRDSFRLAPPINITDEQIAEACELIVKSMNEVIEG